MFGEPAEIARQARKLRDQAQVVQELAARVESGHGVRWVGLAGDQFREKLQTESEKLRHSQEAILEAAAALENLAKELEERQAAISRAMREVEDALSSAQATAKRFASSVWDTLTGAEQTVVNQAQRIINSAPVLPAAGDPKWLSLAETIRRT